jgi:hypothetical protein
LRLVALARIKVDLFENHALCRQLNVLNLPFLAFYRDGVMKRSAIGMTSKIAEYVHDLVRGDP